MCDKVEKTLQIAALPSLHNIIVLRTCRGLFHSTLFFLRCQESVWGVEAALEVAERACSPFLQWRPEALFFRAELLERIGRTDDARGVYRRVLSEVRCVSVRVARCC